MNSRKSSEQGNDTLGNAPRELQLQLFPGQSYQLPVPEVEACEVQWEISQIGVGSERLAAGGMRTITWTLPVTAQPHSLIRGRVLIHNADAEPLRLIEVAGWVRKPRAEKVINGGNPPFPWAWVIFLLALLAFGVIAVELWHRFQHPTLVVRPARIDLGTLYYAPGASIETALVFTNQWRVLPRNLENPVLVARRNFDFIGDTGRGKAREATYAFPLSNEINEASIPLTCYRLTNETVRVDGTISLSVSNAPARVVPDQIQFEAEFKPAPPR